MNQPEFIYETPPRYASAAIAGVISLLLFMGLIFGFLFHFLFTSPPLQ